MSRQPYDATGEYRHQPDGHGAYVIVAPDGTESHRVWSATLAQIHADALNNGDRAARSMSPADVVAAIAFHLGAFSVTRHPRTVDEYEAILDTVRALVLPR